MLAAAATVDAQEVSRERIDAIPALMDATVPTLMGAAHVPGTAIAIVHAGRIVLLRGYGLSRLDTGARVDPARTAFRIGSVSKTLTAVAILQLVDAGLLDLNRDIREYLPDLPLRYGATMHQLLTHTAGLDERFAGAYTDNTENLEPLSDHIRRRPPEQVTPPGVAYSYSNYHYALAGAVLERLTNLRYEQYMAERVFARLAITASTAYQSLPSSPLVEEALGYSWRDGRHVVLPRRFTYAAPSGGISATAADMARVMLTLLAEGSAGGQRLLSAESTRALLGAQFTVHPRIPPAAYGMIHWKSHGQDLLHKDGTLGDQVGVLVLAPASRLGIFAASNSLPGVANQILEPLLTHVFGPGAAAQEPKPMAAPSGARRVAGTFRNLHRARHDMSRAISLMLQSRVSAEPDGGIQWRGRRYLEVEPMVFTSLDGRDTIVFRQNADGRMMLHTWGVTYEHVGWYESAPFHLGLLVTCAIVFAWYPTAALITRLRRGRRDAQGRIARRCAVTIALANLAFIVWLAVSLRGLGASVPLPAATVMWLSVPLLTAAMAVAAAVCVVVALRRRWWTARERFSYAAFTAVAAAFIVFLDYWKLFGVRY